MHESLWSLLTDPNHWGLELISEGVFFALELFVLDRLLHRHGP